MYYCAYKSGFLSILHSLDKLNRKKSKQLQLHEDSEESKDTAGTDVVSSSVDGGMQLLL